MWKRAFLRTEQKMNLIGDFYFCSLAKGANVQDLLQLDVALFYRVFSNVIDLEKPPALATAGR